MCWPEDIGGRCGRFEFRCQVAKGTWSGHWVVLWTRMVLAVGMTGEQIIGLVMLFRRCWTRPVIEANLSKLDTGAAPTFTFFAPSLTVGWLGCGMKRKAGVDEVVPLLTVARE
ncbi:unnamed protein product [Cercospora beticola]|nr:unnamed protein product [Cercospora beticola]